jgi:hypothetical protein
MYRLGLALLLMASFGCKEKKSAEPENQEEKTSGSYQKLFPGASVPYQLTDTALLAHDDTTTISDPGFALPDSIAKSIFGGPKVKYFPLASVKTSSGTLLVVKAQAGGRTAAFVVPNSANNKLGPILPFLVPDRDASSNQTGSIDRNGSITRTMAKKINDQMAEGREVFAYDGSAGTFNLVMTDMLDDRNIEVINPIDTLPRQHKFAGDYYKDKNNIVSVRDSRYPNQLTVFIHTSKDNGDCQGEIKADMLLTSSTTAIYRQGGDPCVLELKFSGNSVVLREREGCGSRRGMDCVFDGTYTKKKEVKEKKPKRPQP